MANFESGEQASEMALELWSTVLKEEAINEMLRKNKMTIFTEFNDPEALLWIGPEEVLIGEAAKKDSTIQLKMAWTVGKGLYSDKLSLTTAISSGEMKVKGPLMKLLKVAGILKKAHTIWPGICKKNNIPI